MLTALAYTHKKTYAHAYLKRGWLGMKTLVIQDKNSVMDANPLPQAGITLGLYALWVFPDSSCLIFHKSDLWRCIPGIFQFTSPLSVFDGLIKINDTWLHASRSLQKDLLAAMKHQHKTLDMAHTHITDNPYDMDALETQLAPALKSLRGEGSVFVFAPYKTLKGTGPIHVTIIGDVNVPDYFAGIFSSCAKSMTLPFHLPNQGPKDRGGICFSTHLSPQSAHDVIQSASLPRFEGPSVELELL